MTFIKKKIKTIYLETQQTQSYKEFHLSKLYNQLYEKHTELKYEPSDYPIDKCEKLWSYGSPATST